MKSDAAETVAELLRVRTPTPRREQIVHQHDQRRSLIERAPTLGRDIGALHAGAACAFAGDLVLVLGRRRGD